MPTRHCSDAEDATQEACVKAWLALDRFRAQAPFRPWLVRIAINEARNRRRGAGRRDGLALRLAEDPPGTRVAPAAEDEVLAAEQRARLAAQLGLLSESDQLVIAARYLLGVVRVGDRDRACNATRHRQVAPLTGAGTAARAVGANPMNDQLEQQLLALGEALEIPRTPELIPAVISRLPDRRARRAWPPRPARRSLALALAVLLALAGAAFAVPSTRHTILRVLGLRGVTIERVPQLPALPPGSGKRLALGHRIPLVRARGAASFTALLTPHPTATYLATDVAGGRLSVLDGGVLITEFRGSTIPVVFKLIGPGTHVAQQVIDGNPSVYLSGAPHEVLFLGSDGDLQTERVRLAGNVLVWQRGAVTVLIEGTHTLDQAVAVARSLS